MFRYISGRDHQRYRRRRKASSRCLRSQYGRQTTPTYLPLILASHGSTSRCTPRDTCSSINCYLLLKLKTLALCKSCSQRRRISFSYKLSHLRLPLYSICVSFTILCMFVFIERHIIIYVGELTHYIHNCLILYPFDEYD